MTARGWPEGYQPTVSNVAGTVNDPGGRSVLLWAIAPESSEDNPSDPAVTRNENENENENGNANENENEDVVKNVVEVATESEVENNEVNEAEDNEVENNDDDSDSEESIGAFKVALGWFVNRRSDFLTLVGTRQGVTLTSDMDVDPEGTGAFAMSAMIMRSLQRRMEKSEAFNDFLQPSFQADPDGMGTISHFLQGYYDLVIPGLNEDSSFGVLLLAVDIQTFERASQQRRLDVNFNVPCLQGPPGDPILEALLKANVDVVPRTENGSYENLEIAEISADAFSVCSANDQLGYPHMLVAENSDSGGNSEPGWEDFRRDNPRKLHRLPIKDEGSLLGWRQLVDHLKTHSEHLPVLRQRLFQADPTGFATSVTCLQDIIDYEAVSDVGSEDSAMGGEETDVLVHAVSQTTFMDACTTGTIDTNANVWLPNSPVLAEVPWAHTFASAQVERKLMSSASAQMENRDD
jgi:hypothetical protein